MGLSHGEKGVARRHQRYSGFEPWAEELGKPAKSVHRMLGLGLARMLFQVGAVEMRVLD